MFAPTSKLYFNILIICRARQFAFPHREGGNRRLTEGFPVNCCEGVVCRGEQCSPDNNRWLTITFIYNEQVNIHLYILFTNSVGQYHLPSLIGKVATEG